MNWSVLPYLLGGLAVFLGGCLAISSLIDRGIERQDQRYLKANPNPPKPVRDVDPTKW